MGGPGEDFDDESMSLHSQQRAVQEQTQRHEEREGQVNQGPISLATLQERERSYRSRQTQVVNHAIQAFRTSAYMQSTDRQYYGKLIHMDMEASETEARERGEHTFKQVHSESDKQHKKRVNAYESMRKMYGDRVTLDTEDLRNQIVPYQKERIEKKKARQNERRDYTKKEIHGLVAQVKLDEDMFQPTSQKDSAVHVDILKILKTKDALVELRTLQGRAEYTEVLHELNREQKMVLEVGFQMISKLESTISVYLAQHCLDEFGMLDAKEKKGEIENTGISELIQKQQVLQNQGDAAAGIEEFQNLLHDKFSEYADQNEGMFALRDESERKLQELIEQKTNNRDNTELHLKSTELRRIQAKAQEEGIVPQNKAANVNTLFENQQLMARSAYHGDVRLAALEQLKKELSSIKKPTEEERRELENIDVQIQLQRHEADYLASRQQSKRLERMLRGVCQKKPLSIAMRFELAKEYALDYLAADIKEEKTELEEQLAERARKRKAARESRNPNAPISTTEAMREANEMEQDALEEIADSTWRTKREKEEHAAEETVRQREDNLSRTEMKDRDKKKGKLEKLADKLENYMGWKSEDDLTASERKEYRDILAYMKTDEAIARKTRLTHLQEWMEENLGDVKNSLDLEANGIQDERKEKSYTEKMETAGGYVDQATKFLNFGRYGASYFLDKETNPVMIWGSRISNNMDTISGVLTLPQSMLDLKEAYKEGSTRDKVMKTADVLSDAGGLAATLVENLNETEVLSDTVSTYVGGVTDIFSAGMKMVHAGVDIYDTQKRKMRIEDTEEKLRQHNAAENHAELQQRHERMMAILNTSKKTAKVERTNAIVNGVGSTLKMAGVLTGVTGVGAVFGAGLKMASTAVTTVGKFVMNNQKATVRKEYTKERFARDTERIRSAGQDFSRLSSRDIKHSLLRFAGALSGKRSEAAIRGMAIESKDLLHTDEQDLMAEEKGMVLKAIGLKASAKIADAMKRMGANDFQAKNPVIASQRIYNQIRERSREVHTNFMTRGFRYMKKIVTA